MYYIDGYECIHPYGWRGKNLTRRIAKCLGRFRGDPDLTKFYLNALSVEKNKQSKRTKEQHNEN